MDFFGNRPTTISALYPDNQEATTNVDIGYPGTIDNPGPGNGGLDILGTLPLGLGRPRFPGWVYSYSLMVAAKVMPASSNISYGWNRTVQNRAVTIESMTTSSNTYWYVKSVNKGIDTPYPTGVPSPNEDLIYGEPYCTNTLSPNRIVYAYDAPGMNLAYITNFANSAGFPLHTNDYVYEKHSFIYSLTNSIGTTNAICTLPVGQRLVVHKIADTDEITNDFIGITSIVSTTNIPDCSQVTTNEIRAIVSGGVGGTNLIIFDSNVNLNVPNP